MSSKTSGPADCLVCQKHRGEGPLAGQGIWRDELVVVSHKGDRALRLHFD